MDDAEAVPIRLNFGNVGQEGIVKYDGEPPEGFTQEDIERLDQLVRGAVTINIQVPRSKQVAEQQMAKAKQIVEQHQQRGQALPPPLVAQVQETAKMYQAVSTAEAALPFPIPTPMFPNNPRSQKIAQLKEEGNKLFKQQKFKQAVVRYTEACDLATSRPLFESSGYAREELQTLLSNRSAAYLGYKEYGSAVADADAVIQIARAWPKGYFRKARALAAMGRPRDALDVILLGLQFDPASEDLLAEKRNLEQEA